MSYGFSAKGSSGQLVIDEDSIIMTQAFKGRIIVNGLTSGPPRAYGYCHVTYPQVITSDLPPYVFAVPTPENSGCGLGLFYHKGEAGAWTGFSVLVTRDINAVVGTTMTAGFDTGWDYRVSAFGIPGDNGYAEYGLRIMNEWGDVTFDSAWPIIKFKGLMGSWSLSGFTRGYTLSAYWGYASVDGDDDDVLCKGTHPWGYADGTVGLMLSGLGAIGTRVDRGNFTAAVHAVVTMGFPSGSRSEISAVAYFGRSQHPSGNLDAMAKWNLLLADFTGT